MRYTGYIVGLVIAGAIIFAGINHTKGQQPKAETAPTEKEKAAKLKIVPVLVINPGEERELTLSTECTVGITRGGGFNLMEIGKGNGFGANTKVWQRDGLTIEAPDFATGEKQTAEPQYKPLREAGLNVFRVKVTAAKEAKPGVVNLHLVDQTCSGWCSADFRVLVVGR